jgi:hypothetical protein
MNKSRHTSLKIFFGLLLFTCLSAQAAHAQFRNNNSSQSVTYEDVYDDPYDINKLFLQLQPLYSELFLANVNVGFGLEAQYYLGTKFDFRAHLRKTYGQKFDFTRDIASKNSDMQGSPQIFNYYEAGATYHIKDEVYDKESKITLYGKRYKGNEWMATVPDNIKVPSKVRRIIGARLGGLYYTTSTDLNRIMEDQEVNLFSNEGMKLDTTLNIYGNMRSASVYVGGSIAWFRNIAINPDSYSTLVNDQLVTLFFDIMYAPYLLLENVRYQDVTYNTDSVALNPLGMRLGIDGKFNRELGWAYGAEVGFRPSARTRSFYAVLKVSFPVYGTALDHRKEAFGK